MKVLYFSAPWCGPCRAFGPLMDQLKTLLEESPEIGATVKKINVDEDAESTVKYGISGIPAVIIEKEDGTIVERFTGARSKVQILELIHKHKD